MDLFQAGFKRQLEEESPLANRMRPRTLNEYVGQEHILGQGRLLRRAIEADQLSSLIFYGPPGTGKTTLAQVIANTTKSQFVTLNAVLAGVAQLREEIAAAIERRQLYRQRTTLFIDEVHRWNKAQQDALLPHVENGTILLIGTTTANPYFEVNKALVSRSRIFQLKPLTEENLKQIVAHALADEERGYGKYKINLHEDARDHIVNVANGDARSVLNALELAVETTLPNDDGVVVIDLEVAEESIQRRAVLYDKDGDVHYDTISAFIKSVRGSDPDAALYWMAKMVYAGEDPRFIFRRMAILAGEDVGMADPNAITVVLSCWQAFERIGMPEGRFPLAQAALYLATAPKSNSAFAFFDASSTVEKEQEAEVPNHLRDANRDKEGFGHGAGYLYPHAYRDHWVAQQYLPTALQGKLFYQPSDQGYERGIREQVARRREEQIAAMLEMGSAPAAEWAGGQAAVGEIYTTGPKNRAKDAWLQRTISNSGRNLGHQRDRLFALTAVQRHHLILDVNAGSGLLTWEAVRQAPEGGVWALTPDQQAGQALRQVAERLPEIERPSILIGDLAELPYLLELRGESDLKFDRILGRALLTDYGLPLTDYEKIGGLRDWLLADGRLCLIQTVPRHGQRLYQLVDWSGQEKLQQKVAAAEEAIYHDETDPLVNWEEKDIQAALTAAGFSQVQIQLEKETSQRRLTEAQLERWFDEEAGQKANDGRRAYGRRLQMAGLNRKQVAQVAALYHKQLSERAVDWQTAVACIIAHR